MPGINDRIQHAAAIVDERHAETIAPTRRQSTLVGKIECEAFAVDEQALVRVAFDVERIAEQQCCRQGRIGILPRVARQRQVEAA